MLVIDAVVGCGKSTLMKVLCEDGFKAYPEPVINNPLLDKFYYDKKRYSFPLQVFFLNKRFAHIKEASKEKNTVLDRSIQGDLIFAEMLRDSGEMTNEEYDLYIELFHNMVEHIQQPKLLIYLEISTEEAVKRIQKRGRDYEQSVEKSYWEDLNKRYRKYFNNEYNHSPILKINVDNLDFENNVKDKQYILNLIYKELESLSKKKTTDDKDS